MIYDSRRDIHDSIDMVNSYAIPNLNAAYTRDEIAATTWQGEFPECCVCGTSKGPFEVHHEPPRSKGSLLLRTQRGQFVVKPALLLMCKRCHRDRHDGKLSVGWEWDTQGDEDAFLSGRLFADGYQEHDARMFSHGHITFDREGYAWTVCSSRSE